MDAHTWIRSDLDSVRTKLRDSVLSVVPEPRWVEQVDNGGSSIAHLVLHLTRHHDLAISTAIRDHPPLFDAHRQALGLTTARPAAALAEREDPEISAVPSAEALVAYLDAVFAATTVWLDDVGTMAFDTIPDTGRRLTHHAMLSTDDVGWLHRMWADKPVWWLVQWPVVGHGHAHVGEAISIRNRMGLSPF